MHSRYVGRYSHADVVLVDIDLDSMLDDLTSNPTETHQMYARPMSSYSSGVSSMRSTSSTFTSSTRIVATSLSSSIGRRPSQSQHDDDGADDDANEGSAMDDGDAYEPEVDDEPMDDGGVGAPDDQSNEEVDSKAEQEDEPAEGKEEPAKPAALSKRDLLLRKARESRLQTTEPTARALAGVPEEKSEQKSKEAAVMMTDVPSNEVAEWWQVGGGDAGTKTFQQEDPETEPEALATADTIQMYWMDAVEVRDRPGKIYLIGKIKTSTASGPNKTPTYKSCCVIVNNLERYMYLVPRGPSLKELPKPEQQQAWMSMHEEIRKVLIPSCITSKRDQEVFQTKLVERNYAFEVAGMPRGKNLYLKVKYAAKYPSPPSDICTRGGKTFSRVCGAFTRPLENFMVKRKLLGPGWIEIKNVRKSNESASFCHMEYETFDPKSVSSMQGGGLTPPPLTIMSLSLKSVCNPNTGKHEVVALSAITERGVSSDGGSGKSNPQHKISHFTAIRPLDENAGFPGDYMQAAQRDDRFGGARMEDGSIGINKDRLRVEINERMMLSYFLTRVQFEDPDVIVGHNLHKYALDLLISRIDNFRLGGLWSKLTRLRRGRLTPMKEGEGWNEHRMDDMVNGRLFCDTYVSSKELLTSQNNYTLSHLVEKLLSKQRIDVEMTDIPQILHGGANNFIKFLRHTLDDAMFVLQLMHKLEVLPLSKQLANLCGYLWTRTLEANKRAERIEYLLLHEFGRSKHKFIVPEKYKTKTEADKSGKKREASYAGGMVFAPKKGLYDNFVVLLDFNSLYPSIIRVS